MSRERLWQDCGFLPVERVAEWTPTSAVPAPHSVPQTRGKKTAVECRRDREQEAFCRPSCSPNPYHRVPSPLMKQDAPLPANTREFAADNVETCIMYRNKLLVSARKRSVHTSTTTYRRECLMSATIQSQIDRRVAAFAEPICAFGLANSVNVSMSVKNRASASQSLSMHFASVS
eukprot:m.120321 g.120321  ORF g.120321 m.120321 type:complete len:175 (-) comp52077_c0_seq5:590-1114(-)